MKNHGVGKKLREGLKGACEAFFSLPDRDKRKYELPGLHGQRGYIGKNKETAKGYKQPDLKEFFHIGQELGTAGRIQMGYPENIWPLEVPELKEMSLNVFRTFEETGKHLLRAIATYLDLDKHYFDDKIASGNSILRLLHYFPLNEKMIKETEAVRAAAHEDINLITLLMGGSAEGLQAKTLSGEWIPVNPQHNEIVINIGDMLQRLTNNRLRSTTHRVVNPEGGNLGMSRYSAPFFMHPRSDMDLSCLSNCVSPDHPKAYKDLTAGEYLDERLQELGLKKA